MRRYRKAAVSLIIMAILIAGCVVTTAGVLDDALIIKSIFPGKRFLKQGDFFVNELSDRDSYYIEGIIKGTFVHPSGKEYLVVVRRPEKELSHSEGFYNAYVAVFDEQSNRKVSNTVLFVSDEGHISLFECEGLSYIFFAGSTTFQGWTTWDAGLWKAGVEWKKMWPDNESDYWKDKYPVATKEGLRIMERQIIKVPGHTMPDYRWEFGYTLKWNDKKASFN